MLDSMQAQVAVTPAAPFDPVIEMNLELWPSCQFVVYAGTLFHQVLRILVMFLQMVWSYADYVDLKRHA